MTKTSEEEMARAMVGESCAVLIIPPSRHPITLDKIGKDALFVLRKLSEAGYSGYLVGGGVRDLYLGKTPKDFDISTNARPGQLRKLFPRSNTIGRRFRLVQLFFRGGKTIEVSTLRSLSEFDLDGPEAVLAPNNTFGTLSEDARRRDLTINSLFYEIEKNTIIDYVNGIRDLDQKIIRIVGDPEKRINRDPVRMMRAIRHGASNNFSIEDQSWQAISANSSKLRLCPPSRLRDEFLKDLYSGAAGPWFSMALDSGIYYALFPFYREILDKGVESTDSPVSLLRSIFNTIDRTNNLSVARGVHRQKDYFLMALTLIPWVEARYQLVSTFRKGRELFGLQKQIRQELDTTIGTELNLRRSFRQEMVSLLINLSQMIHNRQGDSWPSWLKKKSYFEKAQLFYQLYFEAFTGKPADPQIINSSPVKKESPEPVPPAKKSSRKNYRPAFANYREGGVFGFKK